MKKFLLLVVMTFALMLVGTGCIERAKSDRFDTVSDNMSYQALSSIKLLESKDKFSSMSKMNNEETIVVEKEEVEKYLNLMEELLSENGGMHSETLTSDKAEYSEYIRITTKDLQGNEEVYNLYFNQELIEDHDDDDDDNEIEEEYKITGICISGEVTYQLEGKIEKEQDKEEVENESYFKIIQDKDNYIIVKEEFEQEKNESEHKFKYEIVINGKKVETVSFELEEENGKLSIEVKESKNGSKTSYKFKEYKEGQNKFIKIQVKEGTTIKNIVVKAIYNTETNEYVYDYKYVN